MRTELALYLFPTKRQDEFDKRRLVWRSRTEVEKQKVAAARGLPANKAL
jgi:hypothetical protein